VTRSATPDLGHYLPPFGSPSAAGRLRDAEERRKASRELDATLRAANPDDPRRPSTFGLTPAELKAEGNRLAREGWPVPEVLEVLDLPRPERIAS
jgi:hypothetical protein